MLGQRTITAVLLIPIVVATTFFSGALGFAGFCALVIVIGAWEWANLSGIKSWGGRLSYSMVILSILAICFSFRQAALMRWLPIMGVIWWVIAFRLVIHYQRDGTTLLNSVPAKLLSGLPVLVPTWFSFISLHSGNREGALLVLFLLVLIWVADIAAFFSGRRWGSTRLSSRVSPAKSWEGVLGAFVATALVASVFSYWSGYGENRPFIFLMICMLTVSFSILGDLFESLMKRTSNRKDSGNSIPGHGGVLDRIDSLTAAGPVFVTGYLFFRGLS